MIIDDVNVMSIIFLPTKDNAPLIVNSDTEETLQITRELLKAISWWNFHKFKRRGGIELI